MQLKPAGSLKAVDAVEKQLSDTIGEFYNDPLGFVHFAYDWGNGELAGQTGPDVWQTELLGQIKKDLESGKGLQESVRYAVASGHGVGKTAFTSWLVHWFISTRPHSKIVVTANTQNQLNTKTWRELAKWHRLSINRHWWRWSATGFTHVLFPESWKADATPWSETNTEAFAGTHEMNGVLMVFDEASAISDTVWDVAEGAMTTPGAMWVVFGNPTRSSGKFYDCFNQMKHRWRTYKVDSRKAKAVNQGEVQKWLEDYGEDSDFFRVRVRGEFPKQAINQFISSDVVMEAMKKRLRYEQWSHYRAVIGVDVARFGSDTSIICVRQGPVVLGGADIQKYQNIDTMMLAGKVVDTYRKFNSNAIVCVDGVGVGAGVVDRLRALGIPVIDVQSAAKSLDSRTYFNKRSELYGRLKDWLYADGCLPNDPDIFNQIRVLEYQINNRLQIQLMSKEDIRKEVGGSPDVADAIAYTFAAEEALDLAKTARARNVINATFAF